jgi:hypothetical protein
MGALKDEMQQATPKQMARTTNEVMHDALGTSSKEEERVRRTVSAATFQLQVLSYF